MNKTLISASLALVLGFSAFATSASAQTLQEVRVSSQPALLGSLPFRVATEMNWWEEAGLSITITEFPAGAPQIAASRFWDVGYTGSVPAVLGAARFNLHTIAISDDQSAANALMVSGPRSDAIVADPTVLRGGTVFLTGNSTVDLAARSCLQSFGLGPNEVTVRSMGQAEIIAAMSAGSAEVGGLWAPNTYTIQEQAGAQTLCSGADAGVMVPGNMVARAAWAEANPELVARFLAVYLRAQVWMANHRDEAVDMMRLHYTDGGVRISENAMHQEFATRPTFDLAGQLALFNRDHGASQADQAMNTIAEFMKEVGSLRADESLPDTSIYLTDAYLQIINNDPQLRAFANMED